MQIEVKSCALCPFRQTWTVTEYCRLDTEIDENELPRKSVHENCPLKIESVTVKLKEK